MNAEFWWNKVGAYNEAIFPMQILLIFVALALTYLLFSKPSARNNNLMKGYLSFLCAWNGILFFLIYGRELPGKILGAPLFILAAVLFTWDIKSGKTQFRLPEATWQKYLTGLLLLSAFMYPLVGAALGHVYPESCTFGVMPCPTTVFALALLSAALPEADKKVYVVLLVWALPALGKCLGALDLYEDCILFWTGVYSLMILIKTWKKEKRTKEPQQREFLDTSGIGKVSSWRKRG